MISLFFLALALICTFTQLTYRKEWFLPKSLEVFLSYVILFNIGVMGLLAAYMHLFEGPETAKLIGWPPGSGFQFEIGIANLAYGVVGIMAYWIRGRFWDALLIGWSILLLGCFVGHITDYAFHDNNALWNIGVFIWINDLILPFLMMGAFVYLRKLESQADMGT